MKKVLIILLVFIGIVIGAMAALPIIFKDDIKAEIGKGIASSLDADVYFNPENFSISLFSNFPSATVAMDEFGIVGRNEFEGEVLLAVDRFELELNLYHLFFEKDMKIDGINLRRPTILIKVLENGKANYDIYIDNDSTEVVESKESEGFALTIENWEIEDGDFIYEDLSIPYLMELKGVNHQGSGNLNAAVFDMETTTSIDDVLINYDGVDYLSNKQANLDMVLNMDLDNMRFTFKDNELKVNEFVVNVDGFFGMPEEGFDMDLNFSSPQSDFKHLLSIVPGMYKNDFESIETAGSLQFSGNVQGRYNEQSMPSLQLDLKVADAMFHYPDLPDAIEDIAIDVSISNGNGDPQNTTIDLRKFNLVFDGNPISATAAIEGISPAQVDMAIVAELNLANLNKSFPMEGLDMNGDYSINVVAKGIYDSLKHKFPNIDASMKLQDGYFKYDDYPIPMEKVNLMAKVENKEGSMSSTIVNLEKFDMLVDGEALSGNLLLKDLENYQWDTHINGRIDLEKIGKIMHLDSMQLKGIIAAKFDSKGRYQDIESENYQLIQTSGTMDITDLYFASHDLPQGFTIHNATTTFNPESIEVKSFSGMIGKSDMQLSGQLTNYLSYVLSDESTISGQFDYKGKKFDVNEWMVEETDDGESTTSTESYETELVAIPTNIDFKLSSTIDQVDYDNMVLKNVRGDIYIREGKVVLDNVNFNSLGGSFAMNGAYDTSNPDDPSFDFNLGMKNVSIQESYSTFNTIQSFAPIAQFLDGNFSTNFKINGKLGQDMMPVMSSVSGSGLVNVVEAILQENKFTGGISNLTNLDINKAKVAIKDLLVETEIVDGKFNVKPFNLNMGGYDTKISGNTSLDGAIDYDLEMNVPAGQHGQKFNSLVNSLSGTESDENSTNDVTLPLKLTQTFADPKFTLGQIVDKGQLKDAAKNKVIEQLKDNKSNLIKNEKVAEAIDDKAIEDTKAAVAAKQDSIKQVIAKQQKLKEDSLKKVAEDAKNKAGEKIKGILKFKKNN